MRAARKNEYMCTLCRSRCPLLFWPSQTRDIIDDITQLDQMLYVGAKKEYEKVRAASSLYKEIFYWFCFVLFCFVLFCSRGAQQLLHGDAYVF